ncbi:nitroreductase family protein [Melaminivora suipulveris]|uniref:Nitroreductase family protein n=1 Tax=Melaminivora suipulveris TaxID=2109913 RepID=A0A2R3QF17_9BURK|nr:nitroreductase [Melaminivora suipulveris]AVO50342.1 nitroreductase family protein [Melaminivora suipulveris]
MDVSQALHARRSVRAFLAKAPPAELVQSILEQAGRAASGGNVQPWRVLALTGEPLQAFLQEVDAARPDEGPGQHHYPSNLWEPYRTRRFSNGEDMYRALDIPREDKAARLEHFARNGRFFGAPVGVLVCVDERMGPPQWVDLGIYLQSLMLLAVQHGLATCAQGFWRRYASTVQRSLGVPEPYSVAFGVALGYEDKAAPVNAMRSTRAPWSEWGELRGA